MQPILRRAVLSDTTEISILCFKLSEYEGRFTGKANTEEAILRRVSDDLSHKDDNAYFVAELPGRIIGVIKAARRGERHKISEAYVEEGHRRNGIMTALFAKALEWVSQNGSKGLYLTVVDGNEGAIRFWKGLGFKPVGMSGHHLIRMERPAERIIAS